MPSVVDAAATWILGAACVALIGATLLPRLRLGHWWVRVFDFPKLQLAAVAAGLALVTAAFASLHAWETSDSVLVSVFTLTAIWNAGHMLPFTVLWRREIPASDPPHHDDDLTLVVANVRVDNDARAEVEGALRTIDPDILLVIEIDDAWAHALETYAATFPHRVDVPRPDGLGLALWSKAPMSDTRVRHLISEKRPSIWATLDTPGGTPLRFVGVHPTPPGLDDDTGDGKRDSRVRDAELVRLADEVAAQNDDAWMIAGDFNDVAWSHTTRLFKRLSGLLDPRVGRRLLTTYHAQRPHLRFPVDHVFLSPALSIGDLSRVRLAGSDHFAIVARVRVTSGARPSPTPSDSDHEEKHEVIEEGVRDARSRGVDAPLAPAKPC